MNQTASTKYSRTRPPARLAVLARTVLLLAGALMVNLARVPSASAQAINTWTGAGADLNWSDGANWTNGLAPALTDIAFFNQYGAAGGKGPDSTPNNVVDTNFSIQSLFYTNNPAGGNHVTVINPGVTLTVTNALFVGTTLDVAGLPSVYATINGTNATLLVTNPAGTISLRQGEVTSTASATLDLRGLDTLQAYVSQVLPAGENIGKNVGTLFFAKTNFITCFAAGTTAGLIVGNNNNSGSKTVTSFLGVTNVILSDGGMEIPAKRMTATLSMTDAGSGAYFRNRAGTGRQDHWYIGFNNTSGTGTGCNGTLSFTGGSVDAMLTTLVVGEGETSGTSVGNASGVLNVSAGTIDVNTMEIGEESVANLTGSGTVNIAATNGPAQIIVNNNLRLARFISGTMNSGTLNIKSNAVVTVKGSIIGGTGNSTINVQNGTLSMGTSMGASGTGQGAITTFQLSSSTLTVNLGGSPNPVTPVCTVGTFDGLQPCTLNLQGTALSAGQFQLIKYSGLADDGFAAFTTVSLPAQVQGYLSNNVANSSIDVVITNVFAPIWNGVTQRQLGHQYYQQLEASQRDSHDLSPGGGAR